MGRPVEKKRKKKGRPSLLDLQKRSLRLQQQQQPQKKGNPNPSPNPYLRFPSNAPSRRITRRNPIPQPPPEVRDDEEEDEEGSGGKRREKKLKLVHRIPDSSDKSPRHSGASGSESEGEGSGSRKKRKIETVGGDRGRSKVEKHSSSKATVPLQAESSDLGPTTPLPDKKLLLFILDRLQKKDTYGVFSEPVDLEELPDYQDVIEHPMDFSTVRKKLSRGAYKNLEQFEKDVFLISSNAMSYNAPDTIYYRQARSIQELANKNFENLRQESDIEAETKTVARRGRPPNKTIKQPVAQSSAVFSALDFSSDPILANPDGAINLCSRSHAFSNKGLATDKLGLTEVSARTSYPMHSSESFGWISMNKVDASEQYSGSAMGITTKFGKKAAIMDESSRRSTFKQIHAYTYTCELPILSLFDGEKRQLAAVGLHIEYAYARSLARFAAHLGTVGWAIAAKKIEKTLPPGTRFGRGWVGDNEVPRQSQPPTQSTSFSYESSEPTISPGSGIPKGNNKPSQNLEPSCSGMPSEGVGKSTPLVSSPASGGRSFDTKEYTSGHLEIPTTEADMQLKSPTQIHQNQVMQSIANGFTSGFRFNLPSQAAGYMTRPVRPPMPFGPESPVMHSRPLDMNSSSSSNALFIQTHSSHLERDKKLAGISNAASSSSNPTVDHKHDAPAQFWGSSMPPKLESIPPDLNVRFQSPASPASSAILDPQQPDLALQL